MKFEPGYVEENFNVSSHNHLREFFRLSLWLLGIVIGIYLVLGFAAEKIAERLPPKFEATIADRINSGLDRDAFPRTNEYLQKILDSLVASAGDLPGFSYKVSVRDDAAINAIALPAGNIVVFRGMLAELSSENELAMILAHELGHYAHRDHLRGLGRGLVFLSIISVLGLSGDLPGFIAPSIHTFDLKHSREQESAADYFAIDLVARTYGHVGGTLELFKVLERKEKGVKMSGLFSTHPDTIWRMQSLAGHMRLKKYQQAPVLRLPEAGVLPFSDDLKENKGQSADSRENH
jgi:Zn-dependent protease with chaperone function